MSSSAPASRRESSPSRMVVSLSGQLDTPALVGVSFSWRSGDNAHASRQEKGCWRMGQSCRCHVRRPWLRLALGFRPACLGGANKRGAACRSGGRGRTMKAYVHAQHFATNTALAGEQRDWSGAG
jgi:hypothetical protein